jgi:hypothetical protein
MALAGWEHIWKKLCFAQTIKGRAPIMSCYTLRQRRREELEAAGVLFTYHEGTLRKRRVGVWPSLFRCWLMGVDPDELRKLGPSEYCLVGWQTIWRTLFHVETAEGVKPIFSFRTLTDEYARSLRDTGCVTVWETHRWGPLPGTGPGPKQRHVLGVPGAIREWISVAGRKGII